MLFHTTFTYFTSFLWNKKGKTVDLCAVLNMKIVTVKQVNLVGNLILWKGQICKIKLQQSCKFYIGNNGKFQFSQNQVATELALISNSRKKKKNCCEVNLL